MRSPSGVNAARGGKHTTRAIAGKLRQLAWWTSGARIDLDGSGRAAYRVASSGFIPTPADWQEGGVRR